MKAPELQNPKHNYIEHLNTQLYERTVKRLREVSSGTTPFGCKRLAFAAAAAAADEVYIDADVEVEVDVEVVVDVVVLISISRQSRNRLRVVFSSHNTRLCRMLAWHRPGCGSRDAMLAQRIEIVATPHSRFIKGGVQWKQGVVVFIIL